MKEMRIKSFYGDYEVHFNEKIDYAGIIAEGDVVILDRTVRDICRQDFDGILNDGNTIILDATEEQKSYAGVGRIIDSLIQKGIHRNNKLVAIGGGITQDVTAFTASVLYRGMRWELIPTTLLAQCDSCIGSKTSINFKGYKNQLGGFYPPRNVYISTHFLKSLGEREIKSGFGEMLHYYVAGGEQDFSLYEENYENGLNDDKVLERLITRSLEIKKKYIEIDEYDRNERQIFNYGHSFGHAIESMTDYRVPHGIAVSHGMDIANYIAVRLGLQKEETMNRIRKVAESFWYEDDLTGLDIDEYIGFLKKDKKNAGNKLGVILCSNMGNLSKYMINADESFKTILCDYFKENLKEAVR